MPQRPAPRILRASGPPSPALLLARVASLAIQGAPPGAQVLLDENPIGTVQDDGGFSASSVAPGSHSIELRHEFYKPKKIEKRFDAGASVQVAAADVVMEKLPATLKITVTPTDARVTINRAGEAPRHPCNEPRRD